MDTPGSRRYLRGVRLTLVVAVATASVGALHAAGAATLGGVRPASMKAQNDAVAPLAGTRVTCDNFALAAATGSAVASRPVQLPANCGSGTWQAHTGTWTITTGQAGASNTANANASIAVGSTDMTAEATVLNANAAGRVGGVTVSHTGSTRIYLAGVVSALNQVQIRYVNVGTITTLATAVATIGASTVLRLTRQGAAVTLRVDGTVRATAALTAAQVTALAAGTRAGLYASSSTALRFSGIYVTTAFP